MTGVGEVIGPASAVPVGGGTIFAARGLVVTQPEPGTFIAFDTTCPHRQCQVKAVAAGTINCFCHGSRFRIADGSVAGGPAPGPLARREVVVVDGTLQLP
jgi:Rieske Fe-S protein